MLHKKVKIMNKHTFQSRLLSSKIGPPLYLGLVGSVSCCLAARFTEQVHAALSARKGSFTYLQNKKQNRKTFHIMLSVADRIWNTSANQGILLTRWPLLLPRDEAAPKPSVFDLLQSQNYELEASKILQPPSES